MSRVTRTERGWAGHYILADRCGFRRNTLLDNGVFKVVVSSVGHLRAHEPDANKIGKIETVGAFGRYFETMAFYADIKDTRYHDADVHKPYDFKGDRFVNDPHGDDTANDMHERIVEEIMKDMSHWATGEAQ